MMQKYNNKIEEIITLFDFQPLLDRIQSLFLFFIVSKRMNKPFLLIILYFGFHRFQSISKPIIVVFRFRNK